MKKTIFFITGIFLIFIDGTGIFLPFGNAVVYSEGNTTSRNCINLNQEQLLEDEDTNVSNRKSYVALLDESVHEHIANYWSDKGIERYHLRIPIYENYFLWVASWIYPSIFKKYEFSDYNKAIERGLGLCSEHAIIITGILNHKGIESKIIRLPGHVVATALVEETKNEWWTLDPTYGVTIPYNIQQIEQNPNMIGAYYSDRGYSKKQIENLLNMYKKGALSISDVRKYDSHIKSYALKYYLEKITYLLKWGLPLLLVLPFLKRIIKEKMNFGYRKSTERER